MRNTHPLMRIVLTVFTIAVSLFFVLPLLWFAFAPFNEQATLGVAVPERFSLANFQTVFDNQVAMRGLIQNSMIIGVGSMVGTALVAALTAYGLSRGSVPGRSVMTYVLILFSSIVTGTASMVPIFLLIFNLGLINTHLGVVLVMIGGLLPAAIFIMQDFVDSVPRSYEEAAIVAGASPFRIFLDVTFPMIRPGMMVVAIWAFVNAWGAFLIPFILLRSPDKLPAAVAFFQFYDEIGSPQIRLISAYAVLYTAPAILLYLLVNWRYGFRFFGGIKQ
jgi:multiple sugar transport system permease protein